MFSTAKRKSYVILIAIAFLGLIIAAGSYVWSQLAVFKEEVVWRQIHYWQDDEEVVSLFRQNPEEPLPGVGIPDEEIPGGITDENLLNFLKARHPDFQFEIVHKIQFNLSAIKDVAEGEESLKDSYAEVRLEVVRDEKGDATRFNVENFVKNEKYGYESEDEISFGVNDGTLCYAESSPWAVIGKAKDEVTRIEPRPGYMYFVSYRKQ
ncbi:TPA: hypothetical protein EYP66_15555 [Candidatus Poribacteria bacterium]|nr:hypothetical protein [Candidatus Poribacteria bacterium]